MLQKRKALWRGIRRRGKGYQIEVRVKGHEPVYETFPPDTTPGEMQARRKALAASLGTHHAAGTIDADAVNYLKARAAMPGIKTRTRHIGLWVAEFTGRARSTIKPWEIAAVRDRWLTVGPKYVATKHGELRQVFLADGRPAPLSPSQVNKRLRALENLWTLLDGRKADNPVREAGEAHEPEPEARGLPYEVIEAILAEMPDRGRGEKGAKRATVSLTKLRLRAIAYAGLAHCELMQVEPKHLHLDESPPWVLVKGRRKGKGTRETPQLLTAQGVGALRALAAAPGGLGRFSASPMLKSLRRACEKLHLTGIRPYDFRHSFATETFRKTGGNLAVTRLLMRQQDERTTLRYAKGAVNPVLEAAIEQLKLGGAFAAENAADPHPANETGAENAG